MAVNAKTRDIAWRVPLGASDELEAKRSITSARSARADRFATAGGLVFIAGTNDQRFPSGITQNRPYGIT